MFLALKFLKPQLDPKSMMFDFGKAAMNASKYVFPPVNMKGCFYHLTQSIWWHVQSNGLQVRYTKFVLIQILHSN